MCTLRIRTILFVIAALLLSSCSGEQEDFEPSGRVVKVGFIGPLSGTELALGNSSLQGAKAALQHSPYLLNGDQVELVVIDDQGEPKLVKQAVDELLKDSSISALLLGSSSESILSLSDYFDKNEIPSVALLATHPDITNGKYVVQLPFDDALQATVTALYIMDELIIDKVAVFMEPDDVHSAFLAENFADTFRDAGGEVELLDYPRTNNDIRETLVRLQDTGVQLLYLPLRGSAVVEIETACRTAEYYPEVMLSDGVLSRILLDHNEDFGIVEGMMAVDVYTLNRMTREYGQKIKEIYERSFTTPSTTYTALGAEGMSILLGAMDGCGDSSDRDCINRNLHATSDFIGVNGPVSFTPEGKSERPIFINKIVDGDLIFEVVVY